MIGDNTTRSCSSNHSSISYTNHRTAARTTTGSRKTSSSTLRADSFPPLLSFTYSDSTHHENSDTDDDTDGKLRIHSRINMETNVTEECPLCCEPLTISDQQFPLECPTPTCHFSYCSTCIEQFLHSEAQGYQEASDGSRQLKVHVACPLCRAKYTSPQSPLSGDTVRGVLLLRQCHARSKLIFSPDAELSARELTTKHDFLTRTLRGGSIDPLVDAIHRYQAYQRDIGKEIVIGDGMTALWDLDAWKQAMPSTAALVPTNHDTDDIPVPQIDPTLFMGLHELLQEDEQRLLTQYFTSGDADRVAQASFILMTIVQQGPRTGQNQNTSHSAHRYKDLSKIRQRFPLPLRHPACVSLPNQDGLLKFGNKDGSLVLTRVLGVAGRSGLRRGDRVTHVQGEPLANVDELERRREELGADCQLFVVVNATLEVAQLLRERGQKMAKAKVYVE